MAKFSAEVLVGVRSNDEGDELAVIVGAHPKLIGKLLQNPSRLAGAMQIAIGEIIGAEPVGSQVKYTAKDGVAH